MKNPTMPKASAPKADAPTKAPAMAPAKMPTPPKGTDTTAPKMPAAPKAPNAMGKDEDGPSLDYSKFNKPKKPKEPANTLDYGNMQSKPTPKSWTGAKDKQQAVRNKVDGDFDRRANQTALETIHEKLATKKSDSDPTESGEDMEKGPIKAKSIRSAIKRVPRQVTRKSEDIVEDLSKAFIPRFLNMGELMKTSGRDVFREMTLATIQELKKKQTLTKEDYEGLQNLRSSYAKAEATGYLKYGDHAPSKEPPRNEDKDPKDIKGDEGSGGEVAKDEQTPGDPNSSTSDQMSSGFDRAASTVSLKAELKEEFKPRFYKGALDMTKKPKPQKPEADPTDPAASVMAFEGKKVRKEEKGSAVPAPKANTEDEARKKYEDEYGAGTYDMGKEEKVVDVSKETSRKAHSQHTKLLHGKTPTKKKRG